MAQILEYILFINILASGTLSMIFKTLHITGHIQVTQQLYIFSQLILTLDTKQKESLKPKKKFYSRQQKEKKKTS